MDRVSTIAEKVDDREKYAAGLEQALSVAGIGIYNLKYSFVLALFLVAAIVEPVGYSYVLPAARCDLDISDGFRGFLASVPYIGIVITSYPWGYLVDTQGRKRIAIYSSLAAGFFGILSGFMPELISFTICKFLCSLCIAGPAAVPYSFIGEIVPQKYRDLTLSVTNAFQIFGSAFVPLIAWGILPLDFRIDFGSYYFRSWRLLTMVNASFFVISAFFLAFGPESPKYLVTQGKHDEALKVLQKIYAGNKRKSPDDYPVKRLIMPDNNEIQKKTFIKSLKVQTLPLVIPPYLKWLSLNGFLLFGMFATLNGLYVWVPDILNRVLMGDGDGGLTACQVIAQRLNETVVEGAECVDSIERITFVINLIANSSCALIAIVGSSAVKLVGKKALLVVIFLLIGLFCVLINFITTDMVFVALLSTFPVLGMTIGPINAYAVEIFPTHLRGMAISLAMMLGRVGSIVGANVAGILLNTACEATFYLFGGLIILCGFLVFLLPKSMAPISKPKSPEDVTRL